MWIDERGSEVLSLGDCRRLLALGAKLGATGHLGVPEHGAPLVLPVNYAVRGADLVIRIGDGLLERIRNHGVVALQVDGVEEGQPWSVLVRGAAIEETDPVPGAPAPTPRVAEPGHRMVRIRADQVTGRRLRPAVVRRPARVAT